MEELKACPHCGKKDTVDFTTCVETEDCAHFEECPEEEPYYCVVCNIHKGGCGASGGFAPTRQEAVEKWNRRAEPENKPLTLEQFNRMGGDPVWIQRGRYGKWRVVKEIFRECVYFTDSGPTGLKFSDYGKTWLAYARKLEGSETDGSTD